MNTLFESAVKEVMDTGILSLPTRKKIWLSMGEVDLEAEKHITNLKEGCKKRIELAKRCVKKVLPEWERVKPEDDRPKKILKLVDNCLKGKVKLSEVESQTKSFSDEIQIIINNNPSEIAYEVSMAAIYVSYFLFHDEPLLEEDDELECLDSELDPDMWDSSYQAYRVYINTDEVETEDMRKVKGMEFWLWYIEQASEINEFKDVIKYTKSFKKEIKELLIDGKNNKNNIDKEISLENFVKFIDSDCIYDRIDRKNDYISILTKRSKNEACCPKCGYISSKVKREYKAEVELPIPNMAHTKVYMRKISRKFYCEDAKCSNDNFYEKVNLVDAITQNCKIYLSDSRRKREIEKLLGL